MRYNEQDLGLIQLCSLPSSYMTFRDTILYSRDTLTLDEVSDALYFKEKMKQLVVGFEAQGEGLVVRGKTHERNFGGDARGRLKSKNREKVCNYYQKKKKKKKKGISNLSATRCRIRIKELLLIRRENNRIISVKLVL